MQRNTEWLGVVLDDLIEFCLLNGLEKLRLDLEQARDTQKSQAIACYTADLGRDMKNIVILERRSKA